MKFRKLRIAWSVGWGLLAVLLCVLWGRSYWRFDNVNFSTTETTVVQSFDGLIGFVYSSMATQPGITSLPADETGVQSFDGLIGFVYSSTATQPGITSFPANEMGALIVAMPKEKRWTWLFDSSRTGVAIRCPNWFLVLTCVTFAALPWLGYIPRRFSLRTLLIATTLIAVVLGLIVWSVK